jgi:hypothetical protein
MTLQQLNHRVQIEADARFGETIERLLFLLEYEERMKNIICSCEHEHDSVHIKTFLAAGDDIGGF